MTDSLDRNLERVLQAQPGALLLLDVIPQMIFQFVEHFGSFDAGFRHLLAPICNGLIEVKHIVPSRGCRERKQPRSIVRAFA